MARPKRNLSPFHPGPKKKTGQICSASLGVAPSGMFMWMYASVIPVFTEVSWDHPPQEVSTPAVIGVG